MAVIARRPALRRLALGAAWTLTAGLGARKPAAETLPGLDRLQVRDSPGPMPEALFLDADGQEHRFAEFFGHGMVINFWATWCGPCKAEMPALSALSRAVAPQDIAVMPLSSDRGGVPVVQRYYQQNGISGLPILLDPKSAAAHAFGVTGIPMTVIIDKRGRERARLEGAADWSSPQSAATIRRLAA